MQSKIALSLEIPVGILEDIYPLTDFGFTLAHMILGNERYRKFYQHVPHMMDNSMYELGQPLAYDDLVTAIYEARPTHVIAPDWMHQAEQTSKGAVMMKNFLTELPNDVRPKVAVVVQGSDLAERIAFFRWAQENAFEPICFPFRLREERNRLIGSIASAEMLRKEDRYHLLGVSFPHEIRVIKGLEGRWSIDTGKPCKIGMNMSDHDWTGRGKLDLMKGYTHEEVAEVKRNVTYLRTLL